MMDKIDHLMHAYQKMADEQSRRWFGALLEYAVTRDDTHIFTSVKEDKPEFFGWHFYSLQDMMTKTKKDKLLIFGAGKEGQYTAYVLQHSALAKNLKGFLDSNERLNGTTLCGLPVMSAANAAQYGEEYIIIVSSRRYGAGMYRQLFMSGVPQSAIFMTPERLFTGSYGQQYFDVFQPREHEVFVDAGCCDANTSLQFIDWCHGKYDKIYAFEGSSTLAKRCEKVFANNGVRNYQVLAKACWKETGTVYFSDDMQSELTNSAKVCQQGIAVPAESIDADRFSEWST